MEEAGKPAAEVPIESGPEVETAEQVLDLAAFRDALVSGIRAMRGSRLRNVMGEPVSRGPSLARAGRGG